MFRGPVSEFYADTATETAGAYARKAMPLVYRDGRQAPSIGAFSVMDWFVSRAIKITEGMVGNFAAATGDRNPLHLIDDLAHGMLVASLLSAIFGTEYPGNGTIYRGQNIKFRRKVLIGDVVIIYLVVTEVDLGKGNLTVDCTICNHRGEFVITGDAFLKVPVAESNTRN